MPVERVTRRLLLERLEDRILLNAATPAASVDLPAEDFINEDFDFSVDFDNTGTGVGFAPYVDIVVPGDIDLAGATIEYLGQTITPVVSATFTGGQWLDGATPVALHPLTDTPLDGSDALTAAASDGDQLLIVQLPFGSFTPDQPTAAIDFTGATLGGAVGTGIDVTTRGGFAFGCDELDNPADDAPLLQAPVTATITPTVIELTKAAGAEEMEATPGANFPVTFTLEVDIANGETIDSLVLTDALPPGVGYVDNLSFVMGGAPTVVSEPALNGDTPGLELNYGSVTGGLGPEIIVTYSYYLPDVIADDAISNNDDTGFTNMASVAGTYTGNPVGDSDLAAITAKQIAIQKGVSLVIDADGNGVSPGDTLEYTLTFQVSDFTDVSNIIIDDVLGDGLEFEAGFTPTYSITEQGSPLAGNFSFFTVNPGANGTTDIQFDVSQQIGLAPPQLGTLRGDIVTQDPNAPRGTTGTVTFRATILEDYRTTIPGDDVSIDLGDTLANDVTIMATTAGGGTESDTSSAAVSIDGLALEKTIYAINGSTMNIAAEIADGLETGDLVTYRVKVELPSADTENLVLTDFLPLPVFSVQDVAALGMLNTLTFDNTFTAGNGGGAAAPGVGVAKYGPEHTLHEDETAAWSFNGVDPDPPTIVSDGPSNRLDFQFGTFDSTPSGPVTVDILFTVKLLDKPFGDGLFLTNQAVSSFGDTGGNTVSNTEIVQIVLNQPELTLTKGVVATDNPAGVFDAAVGPVAFNAPGPGDPFVGTFTSANLAATPIDANLADIDAGDLVTFAIVVENSGGSAAFDLLVNDVLPSGFQIAGGGTTFADANGKIRLASDPAAAIGFTEVGSFFSGADGQGIRIDDPANGVLADRDGAPGSNILVITYELEARADINPRTLHDNSAHLDEFAAREGGTDYTDGYEEARYTETANVLSAAPEITKAFVTTDQGFTSGTDVAFGERVTYDLVVTLPEGETPDLSIVELIRPSMTYIDGSAMLITSGLDPALTNDFGGTVMLATTTAGPFSPGTDVTFTLDDGAGNPVFVLGDNNPANNSFVIRFDALLAGSSGASGGDTVQNSARIGYTDADGTDNAGTPGAGAPVTSNIVNINVVEPDLEITKDIDLTTVDAGDTITVTLMLENTGTADAFEVVVEDVVNPTKFTNIIVGAAPAGFTDTSSGNTVQFTSNPGFAITDGTGPIAFTFTAVATGAITPGETITNTANITAGVTLPNGVPATDESRDVSGDSGSDTVDVVLGLDKSVVATSEAHTAGNDVAIGEIVRYRLEIEFPENSTDDLQIVDQLPEGMTFLNDGTATIAFVANGAGFASGGALGFATGPATNNGNTAAAGIPLTVLADQNVSAAAESNNDTYVDGGDVFFRLGDLVNSDDDPDSEFIVIEFNALVGNVAGNQAGDDLVNNFIATSDEDGANQPIGTVSNDVTLTVREPDIAVTKQFNTPANDAGDTVVYDIVIANSGGASGFEIHVTDDLNALDAGVFTLTAVVFDAGATGASIVIDNNDIPNNLIDITIDELGAGESVTLRVTADIANDLGAGREVSNRADGTYTGLPGTNGTSGNPTGSDNTGDAGDPNGERDGSGGVNDYTTSSTLDFTVASPAVDKTLFDADTEFAVGESIYYDVLVTLPEGITSSFVLTDRIPDGMAFIGAQLIKTAGAPMSPTDSVSNLLAANYLGTIANEAAAAFTNALSTPLADGADFVLDFGDIDTTASLATANNAFVVRIETVLLNTGASGLGGGPTFTNDTSGSYLDPDDGPGGTPATTTVDDPSDPVITLVEPELSIDKSVVVGGAGTTGDAGDSVEYTIVVTHTADSTAPAYDLDLSDTLPDTFTPTGFTAMSSDLGDVAVRFDLTGLAFTTIADLDLATTDTLTIVFTGNLNGTVTPGGMNIGNTISGTYDSADGDQTDKTGVANPNDDEITRMLSDDAAITVPVPTFDKLVIGSDEAATLDADGEVTIGETVTFGITLSLPEGSYGEIVIADDLPSGFDFVGGSAVVVAPGGYIGSVPTLSVAGGNGSGDDVTFTLTPFAVNADANAANNALTIQYDAVVLAENSGLVSGPQSTLLNSASVTLDDPDNPGTPLPLEVSGMPGTTTDGNLFTVLEPELQIDKSSVVMQANAGDIVTYTVQLSHTADSTGPAFDLVITDTLLDGLGANDKLDLVVGSVTTSAGSITSGNNGGDTTIQIDIPVYARDAAPITITYQAQFNVNVNPAMDTVVNTATVNYDSHGDTPAEQRTPPPLSDAFTVNVPLDDIQFDKRAVSTDLGHTGNGLFDPALFDVVAGEIVTYRLTTTLVEGTYSDDVVIREVLPDFLVFTPALGNPTITTGGDVTLNGTTAMANSDGFTITFDVNNVAIGSGDLIDDQIVIEYDVMVVGTDGGMDNFNGNVVTNTATLDFAAFSTSASADIEYVEPELVVTKSASDTTPHLGDTVTYTVVVGHAPGPASATGSGITAYDLTISDPLDPSLTLVAPSVIVSDTPGGSATNVMVSTAGGVLTVTADSLDLLTAPQGFITITYDAVVTANPAAFGSDVTNTVQVSYDGAPGAVPGEHVETVGASDTLRIVGPDLAVTKSDMATVTIPGQQLTYTIEVTNKTAPGGDAANADVATNVEVLDTIPTGATFVSSPDATFDMLTGGNARWLIPSLAVGETVTLTLVIQVDDPVPPALMSIDNDVVVNNLDDIDPTPVDNAASDMTAIDSGPDLQVTKSDGLTSVVPGQSISYTITATNAGNQNTTGVQLVDTYPTDLLTNVMADMPAGVAGVVIDNVAGTITWDLAQLDVGEVIVLTVSADVAATIGPGITQYSNVVALSDDGASGPDVFPDNDTATDTNTFDPDVTAPDYAITKTDGLDEIFPTGTTTYTLTVSNVGPQTGTNVVVTDTFEPSHVTMVTATNGGVVDLAAGTVTWTLASLAGGGGTQSFDVTVTYAEILPAGVTAVTNAASVSDDGSNGSDPNPDNNTSSDTNAIVRPDLKITKTDNLDSVGPGDTTTYTITAENAGSVVATGVMVVDSYPATILGNIRASAPPGVSFVIDNAAGTITWNLGAVEPGERIELEVTADVTNMKPNDVDEYANDVRIFDDGTHGPDAVPGDESARDTNILRDGFVFDALRNEAFLDDPDDDPFAKLDDIDHELDPLPIDALFSGHSEPGMTLIVTLLDEFGASIGFQTVTADSAGNWVANFGGTILTTQPHSMTVEQQESVINGSSAGGFNLRTYFSPATSSPVFFSYVPNEESAFANMAANILEVAGQANRSPLNLGWDNSSSYEFLASSSTTTQFTN